MTLQLVNALSTWYLVGLIWLVHAVHYPLMAQVGEERFVAYERAHTARITPVVGPAMGLELVTSGWLAFEPPPQPAAVWWWVAFGLCASTWALTGLVAVPCHGQLADGFDPDAHRRLMVANRWRTLAWSARGGLVAWFLAGA
ncbi:MAG: hypothetical protein AAFZ65_02285 [Planctomycetota bacterium]